MGCGGPRTVGAANFALFHSPTPNSILFSPLWGSVREMLVVFFRVFSSWRPPKCTFGSSLGIL